VSRARGVRDEQLLALPHYLESDAFDAVERLVLDYATSMTETPVEVSTELMAQLSEKFDQSQTVELTAAIAWENFRARFDHALGIPSDGFAEGAICALPARARMPTLADGTVASE
jgi:alkylhydroperoxidase family enzyme